MNTDLFLLIGRKKLKLLYCQNNMDIREYEHENNAHIPFYFYSTDNGDVLLGENAKVKYENQDKNAHYNYFDLIKEVSKKFNFFGGPQKIDKIIIRATEYLINNFLKNVLFSDETVYDLKEKLNINLIFYNDVSENEITFVNNVFKKEEYTKIKSFYYNYILLNFLDKKRKIGSFKGYIITDSIDNNLHINYFDNLTRKQYKSNAVGKDLAIDPKIKLLGSTILSIAINKTGSLVKPKEEIKKHDEVFKHAFKLFNQKAEFNIDIKLSDGAKARVKIKKSIIKNKLIFASEFTKDFSFLDHFYEKTGIQQSEMIFILHKDIHSDNFFDKIKSNYTNVYHSKEPSSEVLQLFYTDTKCANNGDFTSTQSIKITSLENKVDRKTEDAKLKIVENKILQENSNQVKTYSKIIESQVDKINSEQDTISRTVNRPPIPRGVGAISPPTAPPKVPVTPRTKLQAAIKKPKAPRKTMLPPPIITINRGKPVKKNNPPQPQKRAIPKSVAPPHIVGESLKKNKKIKKMTGKRPLLPPPIKKN